MNHVWKRAVAYFSALVLIAALCLACGDEEGERVVIPIGEITDLTGPASPALSVLHYAAEDMVKHCNEEDLIPGVEIKLISYDTRADPARDVLGYDWVRERGAEVVITVLPSTGEILKPFAEAENIPIAALGTSISMMEPPGWVFALNAPGFYEMGPLLRWISETDWDYGQGTPKLGFVGWAEPGSREVEQGIRDYMEDHPNEFDYVGSSLAPPGTMTWGGEIERLKDCDYVALHATPTGSFIKDFHARGYTATFIGSSAQLAFGGFITDMAGWEAVDGMLSTSVCRWWDEPSPMVDMANELLGRYRAGNVEELMHGGTSYLAGCQNTYAIFDILRQAIEQVGAENLDGQAFYDAALEYETAGLIWEGYPEWAFTESKRYLVDHIEIYEWSAEAGDVVRVSDWLSVVD